MIKTLKFDQFNKKNNNVYKYIKFQYLYKTIKFH